MDIAAYAGRGYNMTERTEMFGGKREVVLGRWLQAVIDTYPADAAKFLGAEKDQFHNPVGHTLREGLGQLIDGLAGGARDEDLSRALDGIVRIRAVKEFTPSAAVGFVHGLKGILREELRESGVAAGDLLALEDGVDRLALLAFDVSMQCRERLFEIRAREIRERQLFAARAGA
jgi:hypothetical protein